MTGTGVTVRALGRILVSGAVLAALPALALFPLPNSGPPGVTSLPRSDRARGCPVPASPAAYGYGDGAAVYCYGPDDTTIAADEFRVDAGAAPVHPEHWVSATTGLQLTRIEVTWEALPQPDPRFASAPTRFRPASIDFIFGRLPRLADGNPPRPRYVDVQESVGSDLHSSLQFSWAYISGVGGPGPWVAEFGLPGKNLDCSVTSNLPKSTIGRLARQMIAST